jgi:hypothetical protein
MNKTITIQYSNPPREGKKQGSVKTTEGEYYNIPAMAVKLFEPLKLWRP